MPDFLYIVIFGLIGYLLGSVPFGLVLTKLCGYGDIRKIGSGNIGATNVLRTGSKTLALLTVILDASKAAFAAWIAAYFTPDKLFQIGGITTSLDVFTSLFAGTCGILGHMFPCWLKFKGGKGVSSAFGLLLLTFWPIAAIAGLTWLTMAVISRYSSLSALTAAVVVAFSAYFLTPTIYFCFYAFIVLMVIIKHRANIQRLLKGQESKISFSKTKKA